MADLVVRSRRGVVAGEERGVAVAIDRGVITAVGNYGARMSATEERDLGDTALLPGLVDTHVHVNEPGRTEWEGFATATRAAAAGGVTTILDMPLNSLPPTVDVEALEIKRKAAAGQAHVDVGFWGGAIPANLTYLPQMFRAGVYGFKAFLADSGVPEFPPLSAAELGRAMDAVAALFVIHAESPKHLHPTPRSTRYRDFLESRPDDAEVAAIQVAIEQAKNRRVHILHLSSAKALQMIKEADGVTAETCPHYLTLDADQIPDGATEFKCCPPIRDAHNADQLWQALADGVITCVVSDHSPCTPDLKRGDFAQAWGGIASVQLGLPVMWTAARQRGYGLADVVAWMSRNPADLVGLKHKGRIEVGADADLVAFDPDGTFVVDPQRLHHRNKATPYAGRTLYGLVRTTWLRGREVGHRRHGRLIRREDM